MQNDFDIFELVSFITVDGRLTHCRWEQSSLQDVSKKSFFSGKMGVGV